MKFQEGEMDWGTSIPTTYGQSLGTLKTSCQDM